MRSCWEMDRWIILVFSWCITAYYAFHTSVRLQIPCLVELALLCTRSLSISRVTQSLDISWVCEYLPRIPPRIIHGKKEPHNQAAFLAYHCTAFDVFLCSELGSEVVCPETPSIPHPIIIRFAFPVKKHTLHGGYIKSSHISTSDDFQTQGRHLPQKEQVETQLEDVPASVDVKVISWNYCRWVLSEWLFIYCLASRLLALSCQCSRTLPNPLGQNAIWVGGTYL